MKAPDVKEKIERIIIMGGAVVDPGNITSAAEFNIFVDPGGCQGRIFQWAVRFI